MAPHLVAGAVQGGCALLGPAGGAAGIGQVELVARVALDHELLPAGGGKELGRAEVQHIGQRELERVIARAGDVEDFHAADAAGAAARAGHLREVQHQAAARKHQGVNAAAAIDAGQLVHVAAAAQGALQGREHGGVDVEGVAARSAVEHARGRGREAVVAHAGHQGLGGAAVAARVGAVGAQPVDAGLPEGAAGAAENHVAAARIGDACRVVVPGPHDEVGQAVTVHVTGGRYAGAAAVTAAFAIDDEAALAQRHGREVHGRGACLAEHHVAAAGIRAADVGIAALGAYDQVHQAVAVDVAGRGHAGPTLVAGALAVDDKAAAAGGHRREFHRRSARLAEHHEAAARVCAVGLVAFDGGDDEVGQAVAVDVARTSQPVATFVGGALAIDDEAAGAGAHGREVHSPRPCLAEHQVAAAGIHAACWICPVGADEHIGQAVAVHIAGVGHPKAAVVTGVFAIDHEAAGACGHVRELHGGGARLAKDDVALARTRAAGRVGQIGADEQVGDAVAIDVAAAAHAQATGVARRFPVDHEAAVAGGHGGQVHGRGACLAKDHIAFARLREA